MLPRLMLCTHNTGHVMSSYARAVHRIVAQSCLPLSNRLPFARAEQLVARGAADDKVLGEVDAADAVEAADERLPRRLVDACDDGADKVRAEALLVQRRRDEVGHGLGRDVALLAQAVHVDLVAEEVRDGGHVGGESCQAKKYVAVLEDFGEVVRHGERLHAQPQVARDGDAVLADHGHAGSAVCGG
ncbi:hypothetical protein OPT61_g9875 [Boeremia exigua]|uniref:Uncharacterized protein n=1 Tax=Boeremia exigua TaxID=749465 RepID=A0ACC2HS88_9PLEO|nr:hypothetical protein OPT61_g9875 [Boeremia exigua]